MQLLFVFQPRLPSELKLKWEKLPNMPTEMACPRLVTDDTAVYVTAGGGSCDIHRYDPQAKNWSKLPEYQYSDFGMTVVKNQLTCVGGKDVSTEKMINIVAVYSAANRRWEHHYPPMNTPRRYPTAFNYQQYLVVAGGGDGDDLATVEILDTSTNQSQWFSSTPLPVKGSRMSFSIIYGTLYLLGGSLHKQVLSMSLSALTQAGNVPTKWRTLPDTPLEYSTGIAVRGSLLAMGGKNQDKQRSSAINVYDKEKNIWRKVGDLPNEREDCTCCLLPGEMIFIAGGEDKNTPTSQVNWAAITD